MGRSHDSWRRPSQDVSLDDLTGWRFGRSIVMEIPMSSNAVLVGGNMFFNRKREGIKTKVVHMANRCLYCGRIAWACMSSTSIKILVHLFVQNMEGPYQTDHPKLRGLSKSSKPASTHAAQTHSNQTPDLPESAAGNPGVLNVRLWELADWQRRNVHNLFVVC